MLIPPNLIHSLDFSTCAGQPVQMPEGCDFWVVHDAFGTHPRDIPKLRENITQGFYNPILRIDWLHDDYQLSIEIYNQKPDKKKGKDYFMNTNYEA